jgi:hypothetical protein
MKRLEPPMQGTEDKEVDHLSRYIECVSEELRKTVIVNFKLNEGDWDQAERQVGGHALFSHGDEATVRNRMQIAGRYHPLRVANGNTQLCVQFLAADPKANAEAYREVAKVKEAVDILSSITIETDVAVETNGLVNIVSQKKAHILSYCGHAATKGPYKGSIVLCDKNLEPGAFARVLHMICNPDPKGHRLHGLVLNACETLTIYEDAEFKEKPGFVVSINKEITTAAGVAFSVQFYKCIAKGDSLLTSYYNAVLQISTEFPGDLGIHELHINESRLAEIVKEIDLATNKTEAEKREKEAEAAKNVVNAPVCVIPSCYLILEQPFDPNYAFVLILRRVASIK